MQIEYNSFVTVSGKKYRLIHPGNRAWLQLQKKVNKTYRDNSGELCVDVDMEYMLDYCFENVVSGEGHGFIPRLDNITLEEMEAWQEILPRFLRGKFDRILPENPVDSGKNSGIENKGDMGGDKNKDQGNEPGPGSGSFLASGSGKRPDLQRGRERFSRASN